MAGQSKNVLISRQFCSGSLFFDYTLKQCHDRAIFLCPPPPPPIFRILTNYVITTRFLYVVM